MCTLQILTYVILHQVKVLVLLSLQMAHHAHSSQKRPRALRTLQVNPCQKCVHCTVKMTTLMHIQFTGSQAKLLVFITDWLQM